MPLSLKRQQALLADRPHVATVRMLAVTRFGQAAVDDSPTLLWTMRCMMGMQDQLPFGATVAQNVKEWLWVARQEGATP